MSSTTGDEGTVVLPDAVGFRPSTNARLGFQIQDVYALGETSSDQLGEGAFGVVCLGRHKHAHTGEESWSKVAIKTCRPNALDLNAAPDNDIRDIDELERYCQEVRALTKLRKASARTTPIMHMYEFFLDGTDFYVVSELLQSPLDEWKDSVTEFTERNAIDIAKAILKGLQYIHSRGVVHRDIKPSNILFRENGNFRSLKICDFGLARVLGQHEQVTDMCGSPGYIAPEVYERKSYRFEVDMFSFGSLMFKLLSGERPFPGRNVRETQRRTLELRYSVQGRDWRHISTAATDLIRKLLIHRQERLRASDALAHDWFNEAGTSILRPTTMRLHDQRSNAILQSNPSVESVHVDGSPRYWVEASLREGLQTFIFLGLFAAELVEQSADENGEPGWLLCTETPMLERPLVVTLPDYIASLETFTEKECRDLFSKCVDCLQVLHETSRIAHRNLHLENFLVDLDVRTLRPLCLPKAAAHMQKQTGNVTMKGFHFAQQIVSGRPLTGHFGLLYSWFAFSAPEIDKSFFHDKTVDWWSMGAILYMMLSGFAPFKGTGMDLFFNKHAGILDFDISSPSMPAERLVTKLLNIHPDMRYRLEDVQTDPWMHADDEYLENFDRSLALFQFREWNNKAEPVPTTSTNSL